MMARTTLIAAACRVPMKPGIRYAVQDSAFEERQPTSPAVSWLFSGFASPRITSSEESDSSRAPMTAMIRCRTRALGPGASKRTLAPALIAAPPAGATTR